MQLQNRNQIAYLSALTLIFSYAEMFLPRILPFFRIGFGNIIILLALPLNCSDFLILTVVKSIASCLMAGTLFSPFFLISISQSIISGAVMFLLFRIKGKWLSIYGISLAGASVSTVIQILLTSLYIGKGTFALLGPMLFFSVFSGLITAFFSENLHIPQKAPELSKISSINKNPISNVILLFIIIAITATFMIKQIPVLFVFLIAGFLLQKLSGRKIKLMPHFFMWIFIFLANLFVPSGKVIFELGNITITLGALQTSVEKALKLSITMALSQCCFKISFGKKSIMSLVLEYFNALSSIFKNTKGNIFIKLKTTLQTEKL